MGNKLSLQALAREHAQRAAAAPAGRSAATVYGGHERALRQTLVALRQDAELSEHAGPGEATVHVLSGRVRLVDAAGTEWEGRSGDLIVVPETRHSLHADTAAVILLTVAAARATTGDR